MNTIFKTILYGTSFFMVIWLNGTEVIAQSTTSASGSWNVPGNWTGGVPGGGTNATVNHAMTINANIAINQGDYNFNQNVTDPASGNDYTLSVQGAWNNEGFIYINSGTTTFRGTGTVGNYGNIVVKNGATLIMGATSVNNTGEILVESGGTLIINGDWDVNGSVVGYSTVTIESNALVVVNGDVTVSQYSNVTIDGTLAVDGDLTAEAGLVIVSEIEGSGTVTTTGSITTESGFGGSASVHGSTGDCSGPCTSNACVTNTIGSNQTVCTGYSATALVGNNIGGYSYKWQKSTTSFASGYSDISGATSQNYSPGVLAATTWFRRVVTNGSCTHTSSVVKVTVNGSGSATITPSGSTSVCTGCSITLTANAGTSYLWSTGATTQSISVSTAGSYTVTVYNGTCYATSSATAVTVGACTYTWTGTANTDASNLTNWGSVCTAPTSADNIVIPAGTPFSPSLSGALNCKDLTIQTGATLTNNSTINVYGNFANNGTFTDNGTVVFRGASAQGISGGTTIFKNVTINNSSGVTLNAVTKVVGILTLTSGNLTSNGNLTVNLNAGAIAGSGTGGIVGDVTIKKNINGNKFHYLSSPINGQKVTDINDDIPVGVNKLYWYDETNISTDNQMGWTAIPNSATSLTQMQGYAVYSFNAVSALDFTGTYSHTTTPSNRTLSYTSSGTPASDGWHLVGNPYPCALDWDAASGWTKTNLDDAIYFWNPVTASYATYVSGVGNNGGTQYIPSMQGFWVKVTGPGTGTLGMNNNVRTTGANPATWKTAAFAKNFLRIHVNSGTLSDETVIRFKENATMGFDSRFDAYKLMNDGVTPNLYTTMGEDNFSINCLSDSVSEGSIPLVVKVSSAGQYEITFDVSELDPSYEVFFEDNENNTSIPLTSDFSYEANLASGETASRFSIKFKKAESQVPTSVFNPVYEDIKVSINEDVVHIEFSNISASEAAVGIYSTTGTSNFYKENIEISNGNILVPIGKNTPGIYIVKVITEGKVYSEKIFVR